MQLIDRKYYTNRALIILMGAAAFLLSCEKTTDKSYIGVRVNGVENSSTKATPTDNDNISSLKADGTYATGQGVFCTDVWVADADIANTEEPEHYIDNINVEYHEASEPYKWAFADGDHLWLNEINLCFWSYAPVECDQRAILSRQNVESGTLDFTYYLPTPDGENDATLQRDILFAYNYQKLPEGSYDGTVNIHFYHALTQVRFMVNRTISDGLDPSLDLVNIKLGGIYDSGACVFQPKSGYIHTKFVWSNLAKLSSRPTGYGQNITLANFGSADASGNQILEAGKYFMLIPQTTPSGTTLTATFRRADGTVISREVPFEGQAWRPGYYYTYRLNATSLDDPITFTVTLVDWVDGGVGTI